MRGRWLSPTSETIGSEATQQCNADNSGYNICQPPGLAS